jgi:hypothetical protein
MSGRRPVSLLFYTLAFAGAPAVFQAGALAQATRAVDESYFAEKAYPMLHTAQCERCHSDNGVATESILEFPEPDAPRERITAFGLSLLDLVDRKDPEQSRLLRKPTKRMKHTGGQRIKPGSDEEAVLRAWIDYLAGLSDEQVRSARERVARLDRRGLERLAIRRLTHAEYNRTVRDLLGDETEPASSFPKEDFVNGFKNQFEGQGISPIQAEAYGKAAERLARAAFRGGDPHGLIPRSPESPTDAASADAFVRGFGLRAFRRPLTDDEAGRYVGLLLEEAARSQDFRAGASIVIEAMLQSPLFLFRIEQGPDSDFAPYETAARLSYFLWGTTPDDDLLHAAGEGELETVEQVEAMARRMLDDPRARTAFDEFLAQWMRFDRLLEATRDRRRYREFNADVAAAMAEETRRLFDHVAWGDRSFMEFFTAGYTFVNPALAKLYGLPTPAEEFGKVDYPADSGRSGVLGHGTYLVLTSTPSETSPTARGLFIRNQFLGQEVPPPPPGVNTVLPNITEDAPMTNRQRLAVHLNSESCLGCHRLIDPIGLGFEQYNAIGAFQKKMVLVFSGSRNGEDSARRSTTKELDLDSSGHIEGIEDSAFSTPSELARLLAASPTCHKAIVKQLFRYAFGRQETNNDQPAIDAILAKFRGSGFRFRELVVALVTSDLFLQKGSG